MDADTLRQRLIRSIDDALAGPAAQTFTRPPLYQSHFAGLSDGTAAQQLGCGVDVVPPGAQSCPYHLHHAQEEMFVILNGEADFTVNGRTARLKGPVAVICRMGDSHAILNTGSEPVQWMNFQAGATAGVSDAFDLGDDRVGATLDRVPTFHHAQIDRTLIRPAVNSRSMVSAAAPR